MVSYFLPVGRNTNLININVIINYKFVTKLQPATNKNTQTIVCKIGSNARI